MKNLIITADGLARSEKINLGIIEAWSAGAITATSVIATEVAFDDARLVWQRHSALPVGVHLSITSGISCAPASNIPSLLDINGTFKLASHKHVIGIIDSLSAQELRLEFTAQIDKVKGAGIEISHLDIHHPS